MAKKDLLNSAIIGFLVALFLVTIKLTGSIARLGQIPFLESSLVLFPALAVAGVQFAALFQEHFRFLFQGAKFLLVGALNTLLDLAVLNVLLAVSGITAGLGFSVFKGFSFLLAVTNSYLWNKYWTFHPQQSSRQDFVEQGKEFAQFLAVSGIGFLLNVTSASIVVNAVGPQFGVSATAWPTVGALVGTLVVLTWNFLGYKLIVFKT